MHGEARAKDRDPGERGAVIQLFKVAVAKDAASRVAETLASGYIGQGPRVDEFESTLTRYWSWPILTTNSCTSALDLALHLIGVGPGDEVITTPLTCTATNGVIANRGATIVWSDVTEKGLIDPADVERHITNRTKAIMAVDWGGLRADYLWLRRMGVPVIQDAAHCFRTTDKRGDFTAWSFQAIKFLTTGDGGALAVPEKYYDRAKLLRWYGLDRTSSKDFRCDQDIQEIGYKYHMNDIAASIGLANFDLAVRNVALQWSNSGKITDSPQCQWVAFVRVKDRPRFIEEAARLGVTTSLVHKRNDRHSAFIGASKNPHEARPVLDAYDREYIAVPCGWWLEKGQVNMIAELVREWRKEE
jgi:hypothetical protein